MKKMFLAALMVCATVVAANAAPAYHPHRGIILAPVVVRPVYRPVVVAPYRRVYVAPRVVVRPAPVYVAPRVVRPVVVIR